MSKIRLVKLRHPNILTAEEAEAEGYGTTNSIKKQILRGVLPAEKVGNVWLVHRRELERMVRRRAEWLTKREK